MNPRTLIVNSDGSWATLTGASRSALPTIVIRLSQTLLAEIDPTSPVPVEIRTLDYSRDRALLSKLIGEPSTVALDRHFDTKTPHVSIPFSPTEYWQVVLELASAEWTLHWNPLPLDPALMTLDLVRAQHQAIQLIGELPEKEAASSAYPAAQALERLVSAGAISPEATEQVRQAVRAVEDSLPLGYTDTTPYTLPVSISDALFRQILDAMPPNNNALATGSPDWRLTGHGPVAGSEDSISVLGHARHPRAITIKVPTKPHTSPEHTPTYQAIITDPETKSPVATATLSYDAAESGVYTGHTIPLRPVRPTDQVDIRHYNNSNPPTTDPATRVRDRESREATRSYAVSRLQRRRPGADSPFPSSITELAYTGHLFIPQTPTEDLDLAWFRLEASDSVAVRSRGEARPIFKAKDPATRTSFTMMSLPDGLWLAVITPGPRVDSSVLRWETRWSTGEITRHECALDETDSVRIVAPTLDAAPVMIRSVDE